MYHAIPNYPVNGVTNTAKLIAIDATTQWRYNQSGSEFRNELGRLRHIPWAAVGNRGRAVLGHDPTPPAILSTYPIRTTLNSPGSIVTTYYETDFTFSGNLSDVAELSIGHIIDDGAVFYLNGVEVLRYNMPTGTITSSTPRVKWNRSIVRWSGRDSENRPCRRIEPIVG